MNKLIIALISLLIFSCSENKWAQTCNEIPIQKRLVFSKSVLHETDLRYNDIQTGGNPKFATHKGRILDMIHKIESHQLIGDKKMKIDFSKEYNFFKFQNYSI